jgi:hypothetical protein
MVKVTEAELLACPDGRLIMCFLLYIDQAALFESIMSGKYEFDEEYWCDISASGKVENVFKVLTER